MSVLARILEGKRSEVEAGSAATPLVEMKARARGASPPRGFRRALEAAPGLALIAEVKKASPSRGLIRADFDPVRVAQAYRKAGAHALSVLTDGPSFQGSLDHLGLAREAGGLPCLRKDFMIEPYQIWESRAAGADAVLLIVAALETPRLAELLALSRKLGMDALVEVHSEGELETAVAVGADIIGINNRDLATLRVSLDTSYKLLPLLRGRALGVAESGIESWADCERVRAAGACAVLIGTAFCAAPDIEGKVREVMGW